MPEIMCSIPIRFKLRTMNLYSMRRTHNTKERDKQLVWLLGVAEYSAVSNTLSLAFAKHYLGLLGLFRT
jgi:hypothetical protein